MSVLHLSAATLTLLSFWGTWYEVSLAAPRVVSASGAIVTLPDVTARANAFEVVMSASSSPYCPAMPSMSGWPIPAVAVVTAALLALLAAWLRSPLLAGVSVFSALQGFRHLGVLHDAVLTGPAGCALPNVSVGVARSAAVAGATAVLLLSGLILWQIMKVRSAERAAKVARGEEVAPTLIEMVQSRVIGIAGAVAAEAQRR